MPLGLCARRRSRSPPLSNSSPRPVVAGCDSGPPGASAWPVVALPVRLKGGYSADTALAAPSALVWSPGGTHFWQRSPLSGVLRRWFTSPTVSHNQPHWLAPAGNRFGAPDPASPVPREGVGLPPRAAGARGQRLTSARLPAAGRRGPCRSGFPGVRRCHDVAGSAKLVGRRVGSGDRARAGLRADPRRLRSPERDHLRRHPYVPFLPGVPCEHPGGRSQLADPRRLRPGPGHRSGADRRRCCDRAAHSVDGQAIGTYASG